MTTNPDSAGENPAVALTEQELLTKLEKAFKEMEPARKVYHKQLGKARSDAVDFYEKLHKLPGIPEKSANYVEQKFRDQLRKFNKFK